MLGKKTQHVSLNEIFLFKEAARTVSELLRGEFKKDIRTFSRKEAAAYLKSDSRTITKFCEDLGIDPTRFRDNHGIDYLLSLEDVYKVRKKLYDQPQSNINKSLPKDFVYGNRYPTQVISIQNQKGGVGKTISCLTLATGLAVEDHRELKILLIDMDGQSTLSSYYPAYHERKTIGDLLNLPFSQISREAVKSVIDKTTIPNLDIIASDQSDRDIETIFHKLGEKMEFGELYKPLSKVIDQIKNDYDVIFIDTPPSLGFASVNALYAANSVIIPLCASHNDTDATMSFLDHLPDVYMRLKELGHNGFNFFKFVITNYENSSSQVSYKNLLQSEFRGYFYNQVFMKSEAIRYCSADKKSIYELSTSQYEEGKKSTHKDCVAELDKFLSEVISDINEIWNVNVKP